MVYNKRMKRKYQKKLVNFNCVFLSKPFLSDIGMKKFPNPFLKFFVSFNSQFKKHFFVNQVAQTSFLHNK